jgi:hypothetical protein
MASLEERNKNAEKIFDEMLDRVIKDEEAYRQRAAREKSFHWTFTAALAVFSVLAPILVTYQAQNKGFTLAAIVVAGIVGAGTALQGTFKWGEQFRRTSLTALELGELSSSAKLRKQDVLDTDDQVKVFQKLYELNQEMAKAHQAIIRRHIEAEVALVTQPPQNSQPSQVNPPPLISKVGL